MPFTLFFFISQEAVSIKSLLQDYLSVIIFLFQTVIMERAIKTENASIQA